MLKPQQRSTHVLEHAQTHHGIPLHTKMLATAPQIARATLGRATSLSPIQMHHLKHCNTSPEWHAHAHDQHRNAPHACFQHAQRHRGIPLHAKGARTGSTCYIDNARNSRGRASDRSPIQMRYLVRYTGPEWRAHAHNRRNATRACSQHAETHHGIPFHSKVCAHRNMRHLKTLGGATNPSSIKMHHIERHTGHEWCIYPHTHRNTPHAYFGPAQTPPWTPLHSKRAHNLYGTSESACISWTSEQPVAHQNASCRALHRSRVACLCTHP